MSVGTQIHSVHASEGRAAAESSDERAHILAAQWGSERALRELLDSHRGLVMAVARRYARGAVALEDLVAEGNAGLLVAVRRFDPLRGNRFSTYAAWWIRAHIARFAQINRRAVAAPSSRAARLSHRVHRARLRLEQRLGRSVCRSEVAEAMEMTVEQVLDAEFLHIARDVSLGPASQDTHWDPVDGGADPESHAIAFEDRDTHRRLAQLAMHVLDDREREIVRRRYLGDRRQTLAELGLSLGVSRERVRQLEERALRKMRAALTRRIRPSQPAKVA